MMSTRTAAICAALLLLVIAAPSVRSAAAGPGASRITLDARAFTPGELVIVTVAVPEGTTSVRVRALGHDAPAYPLTPTRWQALVGIDLDQRTGAFEVTAEALEGSTPRGTVTHPLVVAAKQFPTRRLTVNPDFVNPPPDVMERIARESTLLQGIYTQSAAERLWQPPWIRPVPGTANSRFGTRSVFNGEARNPHGGADFLSGAGTPVKAPNAGRVVVARDLYFTGNTVIIDHGLGLFSMLAHLSRLDVHEGDAIAAGQVVGLVGATGRVTGPHLHWSLRVDGARVDPLAMLALLGRRKG